MVTLSFFTFEFCVKLNSYSSCWLKLSKYFGQNIFENKILQITKTQSLDSYQNKLTSNINIIEQVSNAGVPIVIYRLWTSINFPPKYNRTKESCILSDFRFRNIFFFVKTQEYNILLSQSILISANSVQFEVIRKRNNMEENTDVQFPIETWMRSQDISGFPKLAWAILVKLDLDSLSNCRQVSMTFKNFLDTNFGLDFWIENLCQIRKKYYLARVRLGLSD